MKALTIKIPTWSDAVTLRDGIKAKRAERRDARAADKAVRDAISAAKAEQQAQLHALAAEMLKRGR